MKVERIPTLSDNYTYLIIDEATNEAAIVDAPEFDPVVRRVDELRVRVTHVLSTHHHWDHSGANPELAERYGTPVLGHVSDADRIPGFTHGLEEGDKLRIGELEAEILFIPAHTRGHIAYVFPEAAFTGDCLFAGGCGRLFEGDPGMMHTALNEKLARLPGATRVYCGPEYTQNNLEFASTLEPGNADARTQARAMEEGCHSLVQRGDITMWISEDAIDAWKARPSWKRGGQRRYSDVAIETALTLRLNSSWSMGGPRVRARRSG